MPQQGDPMDKRRQRREAQRKRRQAQVRRLRLTVLLAVLVAAGCAFGIYRLTQKNAGEAPAVVQTVPTTQAPRETSPAQKSPITTIHIRATGDLNVTDAVVNAGISVNNYDFSRSRTCPPFSVTPI